MNIKVPITQVPLLWEHIKFVAVTTDNVSVDYVQEYCNNLLIKLLTDQIYVIVRLNKERQIDAMMIVDYTFSEVTGKKNMNFRNFYSWKSNTVEEWTEALSTVSAFAVEAGCAFIHATSYNQHVWKLAESVGFKEDSRGYILDL